MGVALLEQAVAQTCTDAGARWLAERCRAIAAGLPGPQVGLAFSAAPRRAPPQVAAGSAAGAAADVSAELCQRFERELAIPIAVWSHADRVRVRLLLALPSADVATYVEQLDQLHAYGDMGEQVALYRALPLLADPPAHRARAAEGVRSNMRSLFDAVALDNPYPAAQLDNPSFNQMVLKALFVGAPLYRMVGLAGRVNADLSRMLMDYAAERRAASRRVPVELWRPLSLDADAQAQQVLSSALTDPDRFTRLGAALACQASDVARRWLQDKKELEVELVAGQWDYRKLVEEVSRQP